MSQRFEDGVLPHGRICYLLFHGGAFWVRMGAAMRVADVRVGCETAFLPPPIEAGNVYKHLYT